MFVKVLLLVIAAVPLLAAVYACVLLARGMEDWLGSVGILKILAKHEDGLSADGIMAWRDANWQQDIDTYPNIPHDRDDCERLLAKLCEQNRVQFVDEGTNRRYLLVRVVDAASPT